jgi:tetratricopeptide (TPR) repeat protein
MQKLAMLGIACSLMCLLLHAVRGRAAQTSSDPGPVGGIVASLRGQNFDEALRKCDAALQQTPKDKRIWTLRGMAYAGKGTPSPALADYQHAIHLDPNYLPALEGAAQIEYQQGNAAAATPLILRVLAQRPDDPTSHTMLGFLEYSRDDCADAVRHFEKGGDVLAKQPIVLAAYGACLGTAGQYEQAIPLLQQALGAQPSIPSVRFNLALAQWKVNRPQDALATLLPAIEDFKGQDESMLLAADIYESTNDTQHAVDLLRKAILADPKNVEAYLDFAYLSYDHASMQVGVDILNAGMTQLPNEARLYLVRGILYTQLGKFDEATEDFAAANRLDPKLSVLGAAKGLVASQQHKSGEALSAFRSAAMAQPTDALTQYLLAEALSQQSPPEGSPGYVEEVSAAKLAYRLDPSMVAAHDLLATIYLQAGHAELALEQSRAALKSDPGDQQALYHSILALRRTGDKDQIAALLKQLAAARTATQAALAQSKRFRLQEVPVAATSH